MDFRKLFCWPALFAVAGVLLDASLAATERRQSPPSDASGEARAQRHSTEASGIVLDNGRLSVDVHDQPLMEVLGRISRLTRVAIVPVEDFSHHRVSVTFQSLSLEEGLRLVLRGYDTFFYFGIEEDPPARIKSVWVYPRGRGRGLAPVPPEMWASATELRERVAHGDPEARAAAIEALVDREGQLAQAVIISSLADAEPLVRTRALYAATTVGVDIPAEVLMAGLEDPSLDVRFLALQALSNGPMAQAAAERARYDSSAKVRQLALQILKRLDTASRRPPPPPPPPPTPLATAKALGDLTSQDGAKRRFSKGGACLNQSYKPGQGRSCPTANA